MAELMVPSGGTLGLLALLGGGNLLEEVCYWRWALRVYSLTPLPVQSPQPPLCFLTARLASSPCHRVWPAFPYSLPLEPLARIHPFFPNLLLLMVFNQSN